VGATVTRKDPKSGQNREYYKADSGKLYNDYTSARASQIENVMGVKPNYIDANKDPSFVRAVAPLISKEWGNAPYANPISNTIAVDSQPGSMPYREAHEAGHLSNEQAGLPKLLGVSGRAVTGISDQLGNPAPLELLGGGLTHAFDAREEDRAERLSAKYGPQLGGKPGMGPRFDDQGRSEYGDRLRADGAQRMAGAAKPLLDSINFVKDKVQRVRLGSMEPGIRDAVTNYRSLSQSAGSDITPELLKSSNNLDKLKDQYNKRGGDFDAFAGGIK